MKDERVISTESGKKIQTDYNLDLFAEASAKTGFNTEELFARAAELLYTDYIKYKIGNPTIGKGNNAKILKKKVANKKKKCC